MIIRFFKYNQPASLIILPLLALLMWLLGFFRQVNIIAADHVMPLYELTTKWLGNYHLLIVFTALFLAVVEAFVLNYIVNKHEILGAQSYLPALFYIILISSCANLLTLYPALFAHLFLLLSINKLFNTYRKDTAFSQVFDAGFLISIGSLFYFPSIFFFFTVWIALVIFRPFIWREWAISLMGLIVPYLFVFVYYYWFDGLNALWYDKMLFSFSNRINELDFLSSYYFLMAVVPLIIILSFRKFLSALTATKLKTKKALILLIWFFIFSSIISIANGFSIHYFSFFAIPLAVSFAYYFNNVKKMWWGEFLFFLLLASILLNQLITIYTDK